MEYILLLFKKKRCAIPFAGFTLLELLVVIGILGILAAAVISIIDPIEQVKKSQDGRRKADFEQVQRALELYYQDNGKYPTSSNAFRIMNGVAEVSWGGSWTPYMTKLPKDPVSTKSYVYYSPPAANGQTYYLYASLDRGSKDPQACNAGQSCTNVPSGATCGSVCSYGVSSSNVSP